MANISVMYSSNKDDYETPQELFDELNREFKFTVDLCASEANHKVPRYYTKENDGMKADLTGEVVFCNPPYGPQKTAQWIKKCAESNCTSVLLLPARTDTKAFHEYIYKKAEIRFIKGRVKFGGGSGPAPFPSMIVIFRKHEGEGA